MDATADLAAATAPPASVVVDQGILEANELAIAQLNALSNNLLALCMFLYALQRHSKGTPSEVKINDILFISGVSGDAAKLKEEAEMLSSNAHALFVTLASIASISDLPAGITSVLKMVLISSTAAFIL